MNRKPFLLLSAAIILSACGSPPPSESDVRAALERNLNAMVRASEKLQGAAASAQAQSEVKIYSMKLATCKPEGKGYRCDVEVDWATPVAPRATDSLHPLLYKSSKGWTIGTQ